MINSAISTTGKVRIPQIDYLDRISFSVFRR